MGLVPGPDLPARTLADLRQSPAVVVLDNLETPWELDGGGTGEELDHLRAVPGLRLLASVRGTERPGAIDWRVLDEVPPLDQPAARVLFLREAGESYATDPDLDALLEHLGGVPLAIELMARRIEDTGNAKRLLALWQPSTPLRRE